MFKSTDNNKKSNLENFVNKLINLKKKNLLILLNKKNFIKYLYIYYIFV